MHSTHCLGNAEKPGTHDTVKAQGTPSDSTTWESRDALLMPCKPGGQRGLGTILSQSSFGSACHCNCTHGLHGRLPVRCWLQIESGIRRSGATCPFWETGLQVPV